MRKKIVAVILFLVIVTSFALLAYGTKRGAPRVSHSKNINKDKDDSLAFAKFCALFKPVALPYPPENPTPDTVPDNPVTIPSAMVLKFLKYGSPLHFGNDNTDDSGFSYRYFLRYPNKGNYVLLEFIKINGGEYNFMLASFTYQGKLVDEIQSGRYADSDNYGIDCVIDKDYTIHIARIEYSEGVPSVANPDSVCFKTRNIAYRIEPNGKFKKTIEKPGLGWYISNADNPGYYKAHIKK
jgi:hypothetical protein